MDTENDTPENRAKVYQALEALTREQRDKIRADLTVGLHDGRTIDTPVGALSVATVSTVLQGCPRERLLALFPNHWGVGSSVDEALANARKAGARGRDWYVVRVPDGTYGVRVDSPLGDWSWHWALDAERGVCSSIVATSGKAKKLQISA